MQKYRLEVTEDQIRLIQSALDQYSRIGMGQFTVIKDHPTFERTLYKAFSPKRLPEVGDNTPQGTVLEIKDGKALISGSVKDGRWNEEHEWKKLEDVQLSTDYSRYHEVRDAVDWALTQPRNMLLQDFSIDNPHGSYGIYSEEVHDSCRIAFDILQVIRHEFWLNQESRSQHTVDSHIHFSHRKDHTSSLIKCQKI